MSYTRGRLRSPDAAPATGEHHHRLADVGPAVVDQILSGRLEGPVDYCQEDEEWVVVLHGGALLDVEDERIELGPGDWVLLRGGIRHRLVETEPATSWLTVTAPAPPTAPGR